MTNNIEADYGNSGPTSSAAPLQVDSRSSKGHYPLPDRLDLTNKAIMDGVRLFESYQRAVMLGMAWAPPSRYLGFKFIPGVAGEAIDAFDDRVEQLKVISLITGCDEPLIFAVMETMGILDRCFASWMGSQPDYMPFMPPNG